MRDLLPGAAVKVSCVDVGGGVSLVGVHDEPYTGHSWLRQYVSHDVAVCDLEARGLLTVQTATALRQSVPAAEGFGAAVLSNLWNKKALDGFQYSPGLPLQ